MAVFVRTLAIILAPASLRRVLPAGRRVCQVRFAASVAAGPYSDGSNALSVQRRPLVFEGPPFAVKCVSWHSVPSNSSPRSGLFEPARGVSGMRKTAHLLLSTAVLYLVVGVPGHRGHCGNGARPACRWGVPARSRAVRRGRCLRRRRRRDPDCLLAPADASFVPARCHLEAAPVHWGRIGGGSRPRPSRNPSPFRTRSVVR
jgi:hypothetical protein